MQKPSTDNYVDNRWKALRETGVLFALLYLRPMAFPRVNLTLRTRIYLSMITLLIVTFVVSGVTAYMNFKSQEDEYNDQRLRRKEQAVQESMWYYLKQLGGTLDPSNIPALFEDKLGELSDVHRLLISIYNLNGGLLISSEPETLGQLGFGGTLDYTVLKQLSTGNSRAEQKQDVDYGTYVMAYWYFTDADGRPLAITNVRYEKEDINTDELRDFLVRLTQVYVVLFIAASALAYFLSNYITSSLQKIGRRMQTVDISTSNTPIEWKGKDEIGTLVDAYNRMLMEVRQSANQLAQREREGAWREMAKQVAHEIKNPLTPMKLRVQHLERSLSPDDPNFTSKLNAFSRSMIEQIQSLATIATEFSDFAKMPRAKAERVELVGLLRDAVGLFDNNSSTKVVFTPRCNAAESVVFADREQLLRVFNNLITNARQAIPEEREGKVEVTVNRRGDQVLVEVIDNGTGIPEEMRAQIFVPNFTTKSTGTGLGLAIVHNIVEQAGGSIHFESVVNEGSVFTVELPCTAPADSV